jgi:hypothetical protein
VTTLTQAAITTRKIVRYSIFFVIFLIIGRLLLNAGIKLYLKVFPPAPPPPTVKYGKLPVLPFPQKDKVNFSLTLETAEGGLPTLPTTVKVYYMPKRSANLLSLDEARQKASALGFLPQEQTVSETTYKFNSKDIPSTLTMNIVTGVFSINYDLKVDPSPLQVRPPSPEVGSAGVQAYLTSAGLFPADLTGPIGHEYLKVNGDKLIPALSLSDANLTEVQLFRKNYDDYPSLTADPTKANVWFLLSGTSLNSNKGIIAAEFHYFPVDETQFSTYPIKTAQAAWDELVAGKGYLADQGTNKENDQVKIRKVYLAYYDAGEAIDFYQPIIVFEGDNNFMAYVPAVTSGYYGQ